MKKACSFLIIITRFPLDFLIVAYCLPRPLIENQRTNNSQARVLVQPIHCFQGSSMRLHGDCGQVHGVIGDDRDQMGSWPNAKTVSP